MEKKTIIIQLKNKLIKKQGIPWWSVQWLRLHLPVQGVQVRSLVRELRSHLLHGVAKS